MSYKNKPQIKLYKYENSTFILQAIIDDFQDCSFTHNIYEAGQFTISINYNIPNALLFKKGLFVQFGDNPYDFGEIQSVQDSIGEDGKGSQIRNITGYDSRYILKRRVIRNTNSSGLWVMTAKGELCIRNLINDQCGTNAETKRQLPIINVIPEEEDAIGNEYSVSEQFTNLYEVCKTIATQSEIGWRFRFENGSLTLEFFEGEDLSSLVQFSTDFDSLSNGDFTDSSDTFSNTIYVGGKGQNNERDIYEGENLIEGESPAGLDRFESWDNQSSMTTESEYENEAKSKLIQYGQNITINGNGLVKSPYVFREQYNEGDFITIAFSGQKAVVQILAIEEHWSWGTYSINFQFGKPKNSLSDQLQLMLRQIQKASEKSSSTDSVKWFTIPTDTEMSSSDVTYNTIGFVGACAENGSTFKLYLDNEKTGAKTYHVYFKQLSGGKITFTTGKSGASNLTLNSGTYVAIIYIDENGNVTTQCSTPTNQIEIGNTQPVTSDAVSGAVTEINSDISDINSIIPSEASTQNQLADKSFVNSAIIDEATVRANADSALQSDINDINAVIPSTATSSNKLATESSVTNAVNALDVGSVGGDGKYISAISETNGKINATETTMDTTPTQNSTKAITSGGVYDALSASSGVTGVKGSAETDYRQGDVNITKANIGLGNVDNVSFRDIAFQGVYINTATASLSVSSYTFTPTAPVGDTALAVGSVVHLFFLTSLRSSVALTIVKLNYGGRSGNICYPDKISSSVTGLSLKNISSIQVNSTYHLYNSTYKYVVWEAGTTMDVMWNGAYWVIMGNPVLFEYRSQNLSYRVLADRYAEIWGGNYNASVSEQYLTLDVTYPFTFADQFGYHASISPFSWYNTSTLGSIRITSVGLARISTSRGIFQIGYPSSVDTHRGISYKLSGHLA